MVVATHHIAFGLRVADRVQVLADGRIDYRGDSLSPVIAEEYGLRTVAFEPP